MNRLLFIAISSLISTSFLNGETISPMPLVPAIIAAPTTTFNVLTPPTFVPPPNPGMPTPITYNPNNWFNQPVYVPPAPTTTTASPTVGSSIWKATANPNSGTFSFNMAPNQYFTSSIGGTCTTVDWLTSLPQNDPALTIGTQFTMVEETSPLGPLTLVSLSSSTPILNDDRILFTSTQFTLDLATNHWKAYLELTPNGQIEYGIGTSKLPVEIQVDVDPNSRVVKFFSRGLLMAVPEDGLDIYAGLESVFGRVEEQPRTLSVEFVKVIEGGQATLTGTTDFACGHGCYLQVGKTW